MGTFPKGTPFNISIIIHFSEKGRANGVLPPIEHKNVEECPFGERPH